MRKFFLLLFFVSMVFSHIYEESPFGWHPASVGHPDYEDSGYIDAANLGIRWTREGLYAFWFIVQPDISDTTLDFLMYDMQWSRIPDSMNILANISPEGRRDEGRSIPGTWIPIDTVKYLRFVRKTIERYDGDGIDDMPGLTNPITYWQVGNEPDISGKSDFGRLQKMTYYAIKEANEDAMVLIGGATGFPNDYLGRFNDGFLPILEQLDGDCFDIFDFHWYGCADGDYRLKDEATSDDVLDSIRTVLYNLGYETPIWITEMGTYSGDPNPVFPGMDTPFQTERQQAYDFVKRHVYPLARGVEKIFPAWGVIEGFMMDSGYFDYTGVIYDGIGPHDYRLGTKKLAYYTYKKMTEKLEGFSPEFTETIITGIDNVYAYRFNVHDDVIILAWWDFFDDSEYSEGDSISLYLTELPGDSAKITNSVPPFSRGEFVTDYETAFVEKKKAIRDGMVELRLGKDPVYIEPITIGAISESKERENTYSFSSDPLSNRIRIDIAEGVYGKIDVYDIRGHSIFHDRIVSNRDIDLAYDSSGMYFIRLDLGSVVYHERFIKLR